MARETWRLSITMETAFCVETLEDALARHGKPEIFNTDQGRSSRARHSPGVLADNDVAISMDGRGAWRHVFVERCGQRQARGGICAAATASARHLDFCNACRPPPRPIKLTSPRGLSAWQPNLGRGSALMRKICSDNRAQLTGKFMIHPNAGDGRQSLWLNPSRRFVAQSVRCGAIDSDRAGARLAKHRRL